MSATMSLRQQRLILAVMIFSIVLIWIDGTVLSTAYETLADPVKGLGATPGQLQWATGSYTLVLATVTFTGGALGDRFGHRNTLLAGMAVFGLASIGAAYSHDTTQLIVWRAVMGAGGALLTPATMATISWTFEPAKRAAAFGVISSFAGLGIAAGPVLAGVMLAHFWWGSAFLINVPIVAVGLVAIARLVPNFRSPQVRSFDLPGMLLSTAGLGLLSYGLIRAGQDGTLGEAAVYGTVAVGLVLIAAFVFAELRQKHPSFDPRLFRLRSFASGNIMLTLLFLAMSGSGFYFAFYLQGVRGYTPLHAGLLMVPGALCVVVGAPIAAKISRRTSVRRVSGTALAVTTVTMSTFALFGLHTSVASYVALSIVQATAIGSTIAPVTGAVLSSLPLTQAGSGSAVNSTMRQTGSVLGIALGGTILSIVYRRAVDGATAGLPQPLKQKAETSAELARHIAAQRHDPGLAHRADLAFVHAMHVGLLWSALAIALGAVVLIAGFTMPKTSPVGPQPADAPRPEVQPDQPQPRIPDEETLLAAPRRSSGSRS